MSDPEHLILSSLADGDKHGYAMMADIHEFAGVKLGPGTLYGAMLGFFGYMTYDLTNLATIKAWTTSLALIDIAWGTLLTAIAALAGYAASRI